MQVPDQITEKRISFKSLAGAILEQLSLERGLLFTIKAMTFQPGESLKSYLFTDRKRYTKPLTLLLLVVAIATFISVRTLPVNTGLELIENDPQFKQFPEFLQELLSFLPELTSKYFNILFMINIPALALGTYVLFGSSKLNLAEHFVVNIYLFSIQTIIFILFIPLSLVSDFLLLLMAFFMFIYTIYAYMKIFEENLISSLFKSLGVYFIGQLFSSLLFGLLILVLYLFS